MLIEKKINIRMTDMEVRKLFVDYFQQIGKEDISQKMKTTKWHFDYLYRSKNWILSIDDVMEVEDDG
tara:strand:- start:199 stop:399 length:201 start_codon:yes stop_codon:yes gene_type:complete